ncbi:hypothetical protein [Paludibaculum fermentans]|uniref:hypothetical protein n=1 Tax=Paludibaculum fermentans TaxID=1473598 RepID=UPI003EBB75A5
MEPESGFESDFEWEPELAELREQLKRRNRSIAGWLETPAEMFQKIDGPVERDTVFDTLFDEPTHVVESFLARPDCPLEEAFSDEYKRIWVEGISGSKPGTEDYTDQLGEFATDALGRFLRYVIDNIPPYWSRDQYLLIHDMEVRPLPPSPDPDSDPVQ